MKQQALGLIETRGLVAAIEAADAALKTAAVELVNYQKVTGGLVTVAVTGEVAAVQAAVAAGIAAAARVGDLISSHVIPRPLADLGLLLRAKETGADPDPAGPASDSPASDSPASDSPAQDETDGQPSLKEHLETLAVEELRRIARKTEGIAIKGRQISRANKGVLISEILKAGTFLPKRGE